MDLVAPNEAIMATGFVQLGIIVVFAVVAGIKRSTSMAAGMIWAKLNAPLVAIVLGEAWALASYALFRPVPTIDDYFIIGLWIAGGSGLIGSLVKDIGDGSVTTASVKGVADMRAHKGQGRSIG